MKISVPDLRVYPVMKALTMEVLWLGMAELKFNTTGTELFFREPKFAVVAPRIKSGRELAQKPTLIEVQLAGWCLKATVILEGETSPTETDHSDKEAVFMANDCRVNATEGVCSRAVAKLCSYDAVVMLDDWELTAKFTEPVSRLASL